MNTDRITIDVTPGPWEQPLRSAVPATVPLTDPRLELSEHALVVASQNAFPVVAGQKSRRDNLGLAAGGAVALVLGCATFVSLSSGRHAPATPVAASPAACSGPGRAAHAGASHSQADGRAARRLADGRRALGHGRMQPMPRDDGCTGHAAGVFTSAGL